LILIVHCGASMINNQIYRLIIKRLLCSIRGHSLKRPHAGVTQTNTA
jgi:hypothetical protein